MTFHYQNLSEHLLVALIEQEMRKINNKEIELVCHDDISDIFITLVHCMKKGTKPLVTWCNDWIYLDNQLTKLYTEESDYEFLGISRTIAGMFKALVIVGRQSECLKNSGKQDDILFLSESDSEM